MTDIELQYRALIKKALLANEDSWRSAPKSPYPSEMKFHYNTWWMQGGELQLHCSTDSLPLTRTGNRKEIT